LTFAYTGTGGILHTLIDRKLLKEKGKETKKEKDNPFRATIQVNNRDKEVVVESYRGRKK